MRMDARRLWYRRNARPVHLRGENGNAIHAAEKHREDIRPDAKLRICAKSKSYNNQFGVILFYLI